MRKMKHLLIALAIMFTSGALAQTADTSDDETAELAAELIGRPVYAMNGVEIGSIADLMFDDDGIPHRLRIRMSARLGLGERMVEIPQGMFMVLRGAAVLDLPAEGVPFLPEAVEADE